MAETRETRLRRLKMRSWRRGMKEMDLILGGFAEAELENMTSDQLDAHELLMEENDQDLYLWVSGAIPAPAQFSESISLISAYLQQKRR